MGLLFVAPKFDEANDQSMVSCIIKDIDINEN